MTLMNAVKAADKPQNKVLFIRGRFSVDPPDPRLND